MKDKKPTAASIEETRTEDDRRKRQGGTGRDRPKETDLQRTDKLLGIIACGFELGPDSLNMDSSCRTGRDWIVPEGRIADFKT